MRPFGFDAAAAAAIVARLRIVKPMRPMSQQADDANKPTRLVMPSLLRLMRPISPAMLTRPRLTNPPRPPMKLTLKPMKPLIETMGPKPTKTMSQRAAKADKPKLKRPKARPWLGQRPRCV